MKREFQLYIRDKRDRVILPPVEPYQPDPEIVKSLQPQSRPKPLEGQTHLFSERTEPAKRKRGESSDQQTLF